jgi:hypothetical protein
MPRAFNECPQPVVRSFPAISYRFTTLDRHTPYRNTSADAFEDALGLCTFGLGTSAAERRSFEPPSCPVTFCVTHQS